MVTARPPRRVVETVPAEAGLVVEEVSTGWCGAVVDCDKERVSLEDRHGKVRVFPLQPGAFLLEGVPVTLARPVVRASTAPKRSASGSVAVHGLKAQVAKGSRIWVEGTHDAELVERVWGHDLRVEGVVVEPLDGVDDLAGAVRAFGTSPSRRLGVLVDHLVPGSKESRIVAKVKDPHVLVTGHPYVDVWQAVKPAAVGIAAWPDVARGVDWKTGVCRALGVADPQQMWRRVLAGVRSYADLQPALVGAVERLIDFVTEPEVNE